MTLDTCQAGFNDRHCCHRASGNSSKGTSAQWVTFLWRGACLRACRLGNFRFIMASGFFLIMTGLSLRLGCMLALSTKVSMVMFFTLMAGVSNCPCHVATCAPSSLVMTSDLRNCSNGSSCCENVIQHQFHFESLVLRKQMVRFSCCNWNNTCSIPHIYIYIPSFISCRITVGVAGSCYELAWPVRKADTHRIQALSC